MEHMLINATPGNDWVVKVKHVNHTAIPPVGLTVLVAGNFLWENQFVAKLVESYFPQSSPLQTDEAGIMDVLEGEKALGLVILDEMLLCGDQWVEILHALKTKHPSAKIAVYGTRFFSHSACLRAYPSLIDLNLPKNMPVDEIARRLFKAFQ